MSAILREKATGKLSSAVFPCQRAGVNLTRLKITTPCRQLKAFLSKNRKTVPRQNKRIVYLAMLITLLGTTAPELGTATIQEYEQSAALLRSFNETPARDLLVATFLPSDVLSFSAGPLESLERRGSTPPSFSGGVAASTVWLSQQIRARRIEESRKTRGRNIHA